MNMTETSIRKASEKARNWADIVSTKAGGNHVNLVGRYMGL